MTRGEQWRLRLNNPGVKNLRPLRRAASGPRTGSLATLREPRPQSSKGLGTARGYLKGGPTVADPAVTPTSFFGAVVPQSLTAGSQNQEGRLQSSPARNPPPPAAPLTPVPEPGRRGGFPSRLMYDNVLYPIKYG